MPKHSTFFVADECVCGSDNAGCTVRQHSTVITTLLSTVCYETRTRSRPLLG